MQTGRYKLIGGILLVSGTTIGAGMLALPVITGFAGFLPSVFLLGLFWIYMTYTALLLLEVNLSMEGSANLISMAKKTLGKPGEWLGWITYLFLLYSLTTAYLAGSSPIIIEGIESLTGNMLPSWSGALPLLLIFGYFIYKGTRSVDYLNRVLMMGLILAYVLLVIFLSPHVEVNLLKHTDPKYLLIAVSIVATSFGFHIIIPSLTAYMDRDVMNLKRAIWLGGFIPLVVYILWEVLSLGIIPLKGYPSISEGYAQGSNGAHLLSEALSNSHVAFIARIFSFFAIVTSFLGVSLSLFDCLGDSLKINHSSKGRLIAFALTFAPPLVFALSDPRAFLTALEYAGAFGVVTLLGLLPALMAWSKRYWSHDQKGYKTAGGKTALVFVMLFSLFVMLLELGNQLGLIQIEQSF
ncbi:MAG: tyrosine transporter [Chlamydiales bacterium 38-26]|nr:hypothetical protein [Chlamydiales bacterium]OJV10940.1 MAG: tyrosine transporter [Chlamydiales bacterium 38-26]